MQLVAHMFDKASVRVNNVPIVPKSYDDTYLRPAQERIGERACVCGDACICMLMAKWRYGPGNALGFVGTEFLLPAERQTFLEGKGLPPRRKKCLVCTRYFQSWIYWKARTDNNFKVTGAPIGMQAFGNPVAIGTLATPPDLDALGALMAELPVNASPVSSTDGYLPEAMLFVDEEFATSSRAAREPAMATLAWKPVVRFRSRHYRYLQGTDGAPHLVQVGIGADDATGTGLGFRPPAGGTVAPPPASTPCDPSVPTGTRPA